MTERKQMFERFLECYGVTKSADLMRILDLKSSTISQWKTGKRPIPHSRLKDAVDLFHVRWDWLLEGTLPKLQAKRYWDQSNSLDHRRITVRFLDFFEDTIDTDIANLLDISPAAVHYMREGSMKAPWDKLKIAIDKFGTTWEWLLEGRGTKKAPHKGGAKK